MTTEDWFFYLQDLLDLKIPKISDSLIHYTMNDFVYKCLLNPTVEDHYYNEEKGAVVSEVQLMRTITENAALVFILQVIQRVALLVFYLE